MSVVRQGTPKSGAGTVLVIMWLSRPMRTERDRACPNIIAIPSALEQLGSPTDPLTSRDVADLRRFLRLVADPRDTRGLRYPALALLCAAVSGVLTGAHSLIAIGEWIADAPQHVLGVLGFAADPLTGLRPVPHPATVCRLLQRVNGDELDAAISAYLQARTPPSAEPEAGTGPVRRVIAVDGKAALGSRTATAATIQLLAVTGVAERVDREVPQCGHVRRAVPGADCVRTSLIVPWSLWRLRRSQRRVLNRNLHPSAHQCGTGRGPLAARPAQLPKFGISSYQLILEGWHE
jgi:hypothetical protein